MRTSLFTLTLLSFISFLGMNLSGQTCNAYFTYSMDHCPNIYFFDSSWADTTILCWGYDYQGQGNPDMCRNAHNKFSTNGTFEVCLSIQTADGCYDTWCDSITIDCICTEPEANFTDSVAGYDVWFTDASVSSYASSTLEWDFGDGNTSAQANPMHTYSGPGTYTVCLTVTDSCDTHTRCNSLVLSPMIAVDDALNGRSEIHFYPNPVQDYLNIRLEGDIPELLDFTLWDELGKRVLHTSATLSPDKELRIPLQTLPPGIYLMEYGKGDAKSVYRFVKE